MGNRAKTILIYFTITVVGLFFFFYGLSTAKSFLAPLSVAVLLAMVILPVARWFESKGINRGWASFLSDLIILLFFVLLAGVVAFQVKSFSQDWPQTKQRLEPKINALQQFIEDKTGIRKAIVKMAPEEERDNTQKIITNSASVSQNYLSGKLILVVILAVLYSIGLSVSGVQHAILISILAAVLTLIPYIGNIIGYGLALGVALFSGGGATGAIGVTVTFALTQFIESYVLEPYIVGDKVNLNPIFTIIVVVLGGAVWGVIGMLIAIPALGVAKVIFDNIPALNPLGYLFGQEDMGNDENSNNIFSKTKRWAMNKFSSKSGS